MNILICEGNKEANYIIKEFKRLNHNIVVINNDYSISQFLSEQNAIDVINNDPTKEFALENAQIYDFDFVIALSDSDVRNFLICQIAKQVFHIRKTICLVSDPAMVSVFLSLGIDAPISASRNLTEMIKGELDLDSIVKTLSLENEKISIIEVEIKSNFDCVSKMIKDLSFPTSGSISCIFRDPNVIIPHGDTVINSNDTLVIVSEASSEEEIISFIRKGKHD